MHYSMHQAVKGRNETRFVFLASSIDPLFLFTLYSICPLTLVSIYDDCIHEHGISTVLIQRLYVLPSMSVIT